jgi:hypothetical protein
MPKDNLSGDISRLTPQLNWEVDWQSKGEVVGAYGSRSASPSDSDLADRAFDRLGQPLETYRDTSPAVTPKPMRDGEAADLAWKHLGK